jgi:hypothetical protein
MIMSVLNGRTSSEHELQTLWNEVMQVQLEIRQTVPPPKLTIPQTAFMTT